MMQQGARQAAIVSALVALSSPSRAQTCEGGRPTDPGGSQGLAYGAAEVSFYDAASGRARVHYALSGVHAVPAASTVEDGVPDAVVVAATAADDAFAKFEELGYEPPLSDGDSPCADNGGSDAVDIYLLNFAAADGQAVPDHCTGSPPRCAGFVLVENDFKRGGYADTAEGLRTVVPHELFHLVQNAYDADVERWWAEGSAQWAAKQVYPELEDLERFLPTYFDNPWRPINVPPAGPITDFLYATAIWPVFLHEHVDAAVVREVYEQLAQDDGKVLAATDAVLTARGVTLADQFLEFAAYNAATGARAPTSGGYEHAPDYPMVEATPLPATPGTTLSDVTAGLSVFYYSLGTSEPVKVSLEADAQRTRATLLPIVDGRVALDRARDLPPSFTGEAIVVVAGQDLSPVDSPFTVRISAADGAGPSEPGGGADEAESSCAFVGPRTRGPGAMIVLAAMAGLALRRRPRKDARTCDCP